MPAPEPKPKKGSQVKKSQFVLVRTYGAGIHVGTLVSKNAKEVVLKNARRVWRWRGANTLHELSQEGGDDGYTRISESVPEITLLDAIEVIPCSKEGAKNLERSRWPA